MLAEQRTQGLRRVGELVGSTLRSRDKQEEICGASRQAACAPGCWGAGDKTEDLLQHGEQRLISAWRAPAAWGTLD